MGLTRPGHSPVVLIFQLVAGLSRFWRGFGCSVHQTLLNPTYALRFSAPLSNRSFHSLVYTWTHMDLHPIFYCWTQWQGRSTPACVWKASADPAVQQNDWKWVLKRKICEGRNNPCKIPLEFPKNSWVTEIRVLNALLNSRKVNKTVRWRGNVAWSAEPLRQTREFLIPQVNCVAASPSVSHLLSDRSGLCLPSLADYQDHLGSFFVKKKHRFVIENFKHMQRVERTMNPEYVPITSSINDLGPILVLWQYPSFQPYWRPFQGQTPGHNQPLGFWLVRPLMALEGCFSLKCHFGNQWLEGILNFFPATKFYQHRMYEATNTIGQVYDMIKTYFMCSIYNL